MGNLTITVARKPVMGTVASNALQWGTGGLNINATRIRTSDALGGGATKGETVCSTNHEGWDRPWKHDEVAREAHASRVRDHVATAEALGRWPANLILVHNAGCRKVGSKRVRAITGTDSGRMAGKTSSVYGVYAGDEERAGEPTGFADEDGLETIDAWECESTCPCRLLDEQTGILPTGSWCRQKDGAHPFGHAAGAEYERWQTVDEAPGGASRFFKQVRAAEE